MELKEFNRDDLQKIYDFLSTLESENGFENNYYGLSYNQFIEFGVPRIEKESKGIDLKPGYVPQTLFFLWDQDEIVAIFKVRHYLNEHLINGGGHIGYAVGKKYRGKGYASTGLGIVCRTCKQLVKEDEYYLSCNKDNEASYKAMLHNLGYLHHDDELEHYVRIRKSIIS